MNEIIAALILAIVQGVTEWLPISSSGHLVLVEQMLGYEGGLMFQIALHFGTLMAVFVYFGKDVVEVVRELFSFRFQTKYGIMGILLAVASVPAAAVGFLLQGIVQQSQGNIWLLMLGFLITSAVLFAGSLAPRVSTGKKFGVGSALLIGCAQVLSLFRGITRSGTTIVAGLFAGLSEKEAVKFSYLLSIPLIFGANVFLLGNQQLPPTLIWASLVSFFVSLCVMHVSFKYVLNKRENLKWIAFYVLLVAVGIGVYLAF